MTCTEIIANEEHGLRLELRQHQLKLRGFGF